MRCRFAFLPRTAVVAALSLASAPAVAQVPDGWAVVSSFRANNIPTSKSPFPGLGGLWLVHPRNPGPPVSVSGLGSDLTGAGPVTTYNHGANSVLRRPSDGALLVGELVGPNQQVDLHVLTVAGFSVPPGGDVTFPVGSAGSGGGQISQCAFLPSGDVLLAVQGIVSGPLAGQRLGTLDLRTGALTAITLPSVGGQVNALALDASGSAAYLGIWINSGQGQIWSIPVPAGGAATLITSLPTGVMNLALANNGQVIAGCFGDAFTIDPRNGTVTRLGLAADVYNAVAVERATGDLFINQGSTTQPVVWISHVAPGPAVAPLLTPPPGGWGYPSGIDIDHDPETFGPASPGATSHGWSLAPNPGGLPLVGNLGFSITLTSTPSGAPGFWFASLAPQVPPLAFAGVLVNIDPARTVAYGTLPGLPVSTIPLPIPAAPGLTGFQLFFQTIHIDPLGLSGSEGLELTIL